jgi:outer membrane protein assembly factor BamB
MSNGSCLFVSGNGLVYALAASDGAVVWERELKPGWFKLGSSFVSVVERADAVYAFAYGRLYKLDKRNGEILSQGAEIGKLKHQLAVLAGSASSSDAAIAAYARKGSRNQSSGSGGDSGGD